MGLVSTVCACAIMYSQKNLGIHSDLENVGKTNTYTSDIFPYHTSNSRECMGVNGEVLQLRKVHIFYYKSRENPYQVQVTCARLNVQ